MDEISQLYKELSIRIFTQSTLRGTTQMVWNHAYYDTDLWEQMLQEQLGNKNLIKTTRDPIAPKVLSLRKCKEFSQSIKLSFKQKYYSIVFGHICCSKS